MRTIKLILLACFLCQLTFASTEYAADENTLSTKKCAVDYGLISVAKARAVTGDNLLRKSISRENQGKDAYEAFLTWPPNVRQQHLDYLKEKIKTYTLFVQNEDHFERLCPEQKKEQDINNSWMPDSKEELKKTQDEYNELRRLETGDTSYSDGHMDNNTLKKDEKGVYHN